MSLEHLSLTSIFLEFTSEIFFSSYSIRRRTPDFEQQMTSFFPKISRPQKKAPCANSCTLKMLSICKRCKYKVIGTGTHVSHFARKQTGPKTGLDLDRTCIHLFAKQRRYHWPVVVVDVDAVRVELKVRLPYLSSVVIVRYSSRMTRVTDSLPVWPIIWRMTSKKFCRWSLSSCK